MVKKTGRKLNPFGAPVFSPLAAWKDDKARPLLEYLFPLVLGAVVGEKRQRQEFFNDFCQIADNTRSVRRIELLAGEKIRAHPLLADRLRLKLRRRAAIIAKQIEPFLCGPSLLDVGCGDGLVSRLISKHFAQIQLADVIDYRNRHISKDSTFNFALLPEKPPYRTLQGAFDTTLLLTVLHHSQYPRELLRQAISMTKSTIIIIESVFGVNANNIARLSNWASRTYSKETAAFANASLLHQIMTQTFFDWFYNRVINQDVSVPFNFASFEKWPCLLEQLNCNVEYIHHFGIDQPLVPEYHVLYIGSPKRPRKKRFQKATS